MKVTKTNVSESEISSEIDLFSDLPDLDESTKERIREDVAGFLIEQSLVAVSSSKSPISGESWKKSLNPEYKEFKTKEGGTAIANLQLNGDMLDAYTFESTDDGIKLGVFGSEAPKADGHNNFSGASELPQRRFLPGEDQNYKREIVKGAEEIIRDIIAEQSVSKDIFDDVSTKSELYGVLTSILGTANRSQIQRAVLGSSALTDILTELDLLDLL